jgi:hypothetical protein
VLVVQTDEDPVPLARRLAAGGSSIDLRGQREPLLPEHLEAHARQRIAEDLPARRTAHRARDAELAAAVQAAAAAHQAAAVHADAAAERRKSLLDGAFWCEGKRGLVIELSASLVEAEAAVDTTATRLAEGLAAVEAAAADDDAARSALEQARRELVELDLAGRSESELRRALETAQQSAREAASAAAVAERRTEELRAELASAGSRAAELRAELDAIDAARATDPSLIASALRRLEDAPLVPADAASLRLADDLERLAAEVAALPPAAPGAAAADLEQAEAEAARAREHLDALRRPPVPQEPPLWWDELARLHAAVVDAEAAAGSGFRGKAGRKRFEEALAAEHAFLVEIGYPSHLDALMSGGRKHGTTRPGPLSIAEAEQAVVEAEQRLFELRGAANVAAAARRVRSDFARVRALGGALLGLTGTKVTPELLRRHRIDPAATAAVWEALAAAGVSTRSGNAIETATAWLVQRQATDGRRATLAKEADAAEALRVEAEAQVARGEADAAEYLEVADAARREVAALEGELADRAEVAVDPAERAALAESLRATISELEGRPAAGAEAEAAVAAVRAAHGTAVDRAEGIRSELATFASHAAELGAQLDPATVDPADDLADLGGLAVALRNEVSRLDLAVTESGRAVAGAAARLAASRAALAAHQAGGPADPSAADIAAAVVEILGGEERPTDVLVEPGHGFGPDGWEVLLDMLAAVGAAAPVAVVTADPAFAAWAAGQAGKVVEVVPGRSVDPGPSAADRIDRAQTST